MTRALRSARCLCGLRLAHHFTGRLNRRFVGCTDARKAHPRATIKQTLAFGTSKPLDISFATWHTRSRFAARNDTRRPQKEQQN